MQRPWKNVDWQNRLDQAVVLLRQAARVVVLTGAGISAESGVPTFRGGGGLWEGNRVEEVATPMAFAANPGLVWRFYNARRAALRTIHPNPGHLALVDLEKQLGAGQFTLVTQNVDGLHRAAGSRRVLEIHGSLARVRCTGCGKEGERPGDELPELPRCENCGQLLRPAVVWFYEGLPEEIWLEAEKAARTCDCFLMVGTSAVVYPAAGLVETARRAGARIIEINLAPTPASTFADVGLYGPAGQILPRLVEKRLAS